MMTAAPLNRGALAAVPLGGARLAGPVAEFGGILWSIVHAGSVGLSAYHGYKRNNGSLGWAIGWALLGAIFPVVTPTIAFAQGLGERKR